MALLIFLRSVAKRAVCSCEAAATFSLTRLWYSRLDPTVLAEKPSIAGCACGPFCRTVNAWLLAAKNGSSAESGFRQGSGLQKRPPSYWKSFAPATSRFQLADGRMSRSLCRGYSSLSTDLAFQLSHRAHRGLRRAPTEGAKRFSTQAVLHVSPPGDFPAPLLADR